MTRSKKKGGPRREVRSVPVSAPPVKRSRRSWLLIGLGAGAFVTMSYDLVPIDVYPVVEVQFQAKKKGEQPLTRKYVLKQRC